MQQSTTQNGKFTVFHLLWVLAVFFGFVGGIALGADRHGWIGALIGAVSGVAVGAVLGVVPFILTLIILSIVGSRRRASKGADGEH